MANVEFDRVEKVYPGGTVGVADFSIAIDDAELVVVVGPSGCGKSTVLRMLAGLEEPSSGEIRIGGRVVNRVSAQERNIAMVFQDYALYPHLSVRGNLEFPLKMRRVGRDEMAKRIAWAAELLDIGKLLDRLPKQLSGGQRQRVAMGRALVREPSVFLLDEPLSNLDARLRVSVRGEIAELQERTRTTMLYVTHDQVEAMTLGHRVAVLDKGRLQQFAPPRELYERPANVFVAGFIGTPPMNLFATNVALDGGVVELPIGSARVRLDAKALAFAIPKELRGRPLTAGLRPEAFQVANGGTSPASRALDGAALSVTVEQVESLGHESLVYTRVPAAGSDPTQLVVRLAGMPDVGKGKTLRLAIDPGQLHLFDENGRSLASGNRNREVR